MYIRENGSVRLKNIAGNPEKPAPHMAVLHIKDDVPTNRQTNQKTDRPTNLRTDIVTCRAAEVQLKSKALGTHIFCFAKCCWSFLVFFNVDTFL